MPSIYETLPTRRGGGDVIWERFYHYLKKSLVCFSTDRFLVSFNIKNPISFITENSALSCIRCSVLEILVPLTLSIFVFEVEVNQSWQDRYKHRRIIAGSGTVMLVMVSSYQHYALSCLRGGGGGSCVIMRHTRHGFPCVTGVLGRR